MELLKTQPDEILDASDIETPGYKNVNTAWWDGSQIYGSSEVETERLRTGHEDGKLRQISYDAAGVPLTGFVDNWWFGLHILHSLFVLEHNAICDRLRGAYPDWNGYVGHFPVFCSAGFINRLFDAAPRSSILPGSSTAHSWPRSIRSNGRRRFSATRLCRLA